MILQWRNISKILSKVQKKEECWNQPPLCSLPNIAQTSQVQPLELKDVSSGPTKSELQV